jgi:ferredoxin
MSTRIYYFTGTGNSLWVARNLAQRLGAGAPHSIVRALSEGELAPIEDRVGLVVPVYMYRLPHIVMDFLGKLQTRAPLFIVANGGGDPGDLFVQVKRQLERRGVELKQGLYMSVQSNYIPFGGAPDEAKLAERLDKAREQLEELAGVLERDERRIDADFDRFRAWVHPGLLYKLGYKYVPVSDKSYRVADSCNGCGLCAQLCPVDNIELVGERPAWKNRCEQCMACLQWCPKQAIDVKDKTQGERRYHHPEIKVKDIIAQKG